MAINISGGNAALLNTENAVSINQLTNAFASAFKSNSTDTETENGMPAYSSTTSACLDFFYKAGTTRNDSHHEIITLFEAARRENEDLALRILLWARDVRGGAGERRLFRIILSHLKDNHRALSDKVIKATPTIGRWDDIYAGEFTPATVNMMKFGLGRCDVLFAKWFQINNEKAFDLLFNNMFSEEIRSIRNEHKDNEKKINASIYNLKKMLKTHIIAVRKHKLVEQKMCSNKWDDIDFSHVPSVAMKRYRKCFSKHTENFGKWLESLKKGEKGVKINASAIFPHDVIKQVLHNNFVSTEEVDAVIQQWNALPNYVGNNNILPMVDVSGSMHTEVSKNLQAIDIAVSLGLYFSDKNTGPFKDLFLTFSRKPSFVHLKGDICNKIRTINKAYWEQNTDIMAAINLILAVAISDNIPPQDMPKMLLILSDMQFDSACPQGLETIAYHPNHRNGFVDGYDYRPSSSAGITAIKMMQSQYQDSGYKMPTIVFWNINSQDNVPARKDENGVMLVSGYSPAILKCILDTDIESITPEKLMIKAVSGERYNLEKYDAAVFIVNNGEKIF